MVDRWSHWSLALCVCGLIYLTVTMIVTHPNGRRVNVTCVQLFVIYMQLHSNKSMYLAWIAIAVNILCLHWILKGNKPIRVVYVCIAVRCSYILGKVQVELPQTALTLTSDLLKKCITLPAPFKLGCQQISPLVER